MIRAETNEARDRVVVTFPFSRDTLDKVKSIPGRKFVKAEQGGPHWTLPLEMISMRMLRSKFDGEVQWGPNLLAWGREERKRQEQVIELAHAVDAPIGSLEIAGKLPKLAEWFRPYQRADTKFLASANAINANEQGLGKTAEIIGAIYEAGLENGPHLVSAPVTSLEVVWQYELERWTDITVLASESLAEREEHIKQAHALYQEGKPFFLVINPDMIRYESVKEYDRFKEKMVEVGVNEKYPELFQIKWNTITIDEFHKIGLNNQKTLASRALYALKAERRWAMSGTPMGGRPQKLFGALKFLEPKEHSSYWRWAETWLEVDEERVSRTKVVKKVGGIQKGKEDEFYRHHARFMVRHLKSEVLPQLPPKQYVDVWCRMSAKQKKQYKKFAEEAEVRIDEFQLTATGVLAEYARLKSFATAYCEVDGKDVRCKRCQGSGYSGSLTCDDCGGEGTIQKLKLKPTYDSAKLPHLMGKLAESGIDPKDPSGEAVAVVGSHSVEACEMYHRYLNEQGIKAEIITGKTIKPGERRRLIEAFQNGGPDAPRVMVLSTKAGGVAITLDRADTVHIMDETWVPDDQEQLEDRIHRASRIHQVTCFYYRTRDTLEEYIKEVNDEKAFTNESVLDTRRQGFRAVR